MVGLVELGYLLRMRSHLAGGGVLPLGRAGLPCCRDAVSWLEQSCVFVVSFLPCSMADQSDRTIGRK
jgi:hypothetical protein